MNRPHFRRRPRPTDPEPYTRLDVLDGLPGRTRYDAEWPDVLAAEVDHQYPAQDWLDYDLGGDLAAMAAPLPVTDLAPHIAALHDLAAGMARDDLGTYAEPAEPRGRHRQTDPLDLILADLRDLGGLS